MSKSNGNDGLVVAGNVGSEGMEVKKERKTRKTNESLEGFRASINPNVMRLLEEKEETTGLERGLIVETALRVFFAATSDERKAGLKATKDERVQSEVDNI